MSQIPLQTEAEQLYSEYYQLIRNMSPDFADALVLEAVKCYAMKAHTAACISCRVAVEEELKEIYEVLVNLGDHSTWQAVERLQLEWLKEWAKALRIINTGHCSAITRIQCRGNRSVHGPTADIRRQLRRRNRPVADPLEIWADQQDARNQIRATERILAELKRRKKQIQQQQRIS